MVRAPIRGPSPAAEAGRTRRRAVEEAPWLEEAEPDEEAGRTLVGRRAFWALLAAFAVLGTGVITGIILVSGRADAPIDVPEVGQEIPVLASPGPWKLPPTGDDVDGEPVEGQGQVLFGTGDGIEPEARIALDSLPEDPLPKPGEDVLEDVVAAGPDAAALPAAPGAAAPPAAAPAPAKPALATPKTVYAPPPAAPGGGAAIQLGAFSSEGRARAAFKSLAERFGYLAGLEPVIVPVATDGRTLYRLRADAGSAAAARDLCGRLKVAGEACSVVE